MGQARATAQYWNVTTSDTAQANGPAQKVWVTLTAQGTPGTLAMHSADGSSFTLNFPANWEAQWVMLDYAVTIFNVTGTSGVSNLVAAGWGAPSQTS
jgi:Domain of unknown function (DUF1939)